MSGGGPWGRARAPIRAEQRLRVRLTAEGQWLGLAGLAFVIAGGALGVVGVAALGAFALGSLAIAHVAAVLASHRVGALRIAASELPRDGTAAIKIWEGRTSTLGLALEAPRRTAIYGVELVPSLSDTLEGRLVQVADEAHPEVLRFELELRGRRLGDSWLHGFDLSATVALGLYAVRAFRPCLVRATVLPRYFTAGAPSLRATRAAANEQADLVHRERRGFGMEIRELRDFQAGDPFKHIAWSASARRGKLIAREFESDLQLSIWLLVDCSPSMFWGPPGLAKIDHALEIASDLARSLSSGRDRVGLVVHDHETRLVIEPGHGSAHLARLTQALMEVPHLVHEDRTELTDVELVERVARWFELYEGRTFLLSTPLERPALERPERIGERMGERMGEGREIPAMRHAPSREPHPRAMRIDEPALAHAAREALARRFVKQRPIVPITAYALEPDRAVLRAFARHAGIELPRDPTARPGGQSHGLESALQAVLRAHGHAGAHTLLSLSDFHTADDADALRRVAIIARRHRHSLVFVMPTGDRGVLPNTNALKRPQDARLMNALVEVAELQADENLRAAQALLRPAGAMFVQASAGDSVSRVLGKLRAVA